MRAERDRQLATRVYRKIHHVSARPARIHRAQKNLPVATPNSHCLQLFAVIPQFAVLAQHLKRTAHSPAAHVNLSVRAPHEIFREGTIWENGADTSKWLGAGLVETRVEDVDQRAERSGFGKRLGRIERKEVRPDT